MATNDWDTLVQSMQAQLAELERKRADAIGKMASATPQLRAVVVGQIDDEIQETKTAIDNFQWAKNNNR